MHAEMLGICLRHPQFCSKVSSQFFVSYDDKITNVSRAYGQFLYCKLP